jgi:hypothetical protein
VVALVVVVHQEAVSHRQAGVVPQARFQAKVGLRRQRHKDMYKRIVLEMKRGLDTSFLTRRRT